MIGFVVNRTSGNGKGAVKWRELEKLLQAREVAYEVRFTMHGGHAKQLAEELAAQPGMEAVVALGGDGTLNEVASGLIGGSVPLGCVPSGSGNDFARSVGIPADAAGALSRILEHRIQRIDAGFVNGKCFVISAGVGFDGEVARMTNAAAYKRWLNKIKLGSLSYVISVLRLLTSYKPGPVTLELDGEPHQLQGAWLIAIANMPYYGGGMKICPDARFDDGQFQLCVVDGISRLEFLKFFPQVFAGTHTRHPAIRIWNASHVRIRSERPLAIHGDGEWAGTTPADIELQAGSLLIL
ncbi:diacylglycerol/lipid kinase family protein [Paenibacillus koleovorans]|uniref:diacylglycerol/lipid kinase family protein n=1 Tax=Paenibacillus koleovorans TaxID=121608 RepID=UPI0013E2B18E|nr:diacylglycerol kinase family protein [Paenibacillus koleovorans]